MTATSDEGGRSVDACPVCGEHRLAVLTFPDLSGSRPTEGEVVLAGRSADPAPPPIGCLACGAEWPDVDTFRQAVETRAG